MILSGESVYYVTGSTNHISTVYIVIYGVLASPVILSKITLVNGF